MSSPTGVGQRLYVLLSVLVALAPPIGFFVVRGADNALVNAILKECISENFRLFSICFEKAQNESYSGLWHLLPFIPAVLVACGRWVLGFPRPLFALSGSRLYLIAEGFLILVGILSTVHAVYDATVTPIDKSFRFIFTQLYWALSVLGAPFILSLLLERARTELSYKVVRVGIFTVLVAPFVVFTLIIFR